MFLFRIHDYRAFCTVQAALKTASAVVSSHNMVSGGNGDTPIFYLVPRSGEDIPAGYVVQFAHTLGLSCVRFLRLLYFLGSRPTSIFCGLSYLPRAPAPLWDHGLLIQTVNVRTTTIILKEY